MTDDEMQRRIVRAFWDALDEVRREGAESLQLMLLVTGLTPEGEQVASFRGYYVGRARMVDALEQLADAIRKGDTEPAPEIDRELN